VRSVFALSPRRPATALSFRLSHRGTFPPGAKSTRTARAWARSGANFRQVFLYLVQLGSKALDDIGVLGEKVRGFPGVFGELVERSLPVAGFDEFSIAVEQREVGSGDDEGSAILYAAGAERRPEILPIEFLFVLHGYACGGANLGVPDQGFS